jgi:hypothetical protein
VNGRHFGYFPKPFREIERVDEGAMNTVELATLKENQQLVVSGR